MAKNCAGKNACGAYAGEKGTVPFSLGRKSGQSPYAVFLRACRSRRWVSAFTSGQRGREERPRSPRPRAGCRRAYSGRKSHRPGPLRGSARSVCRAHRGSRGATYVGPSAAAVSTANRSGTASQRPRPVTFSARVRSSAACTRTRTSGPFFSSSLPACRCQQPSEHVGKAAERPHTGTVPIFAPRKWSCPLFPGIRRTSVYRGRSLSLF